MRERIPIAINDRYHHIYYEALELVAGEVERRFDQPDLRVITQAKRNAYPRGISS